MPGSKYTKRYTIHDCHEIAIKQGGCKDGHKWVAKFGDIVNKESWCKRCYGNTRGTIHDAEDEANKRGWKCLSIEYKNNGSPLEWECERGHTWFASLNNVKRGSGCRYCCGKEWHSLQEAKDTAADNGCECLSEEYYECDTGLAWKCLICNDTWTRSLYDAITHSRWCSKCAPKIRRKRQRILMGMVERILGLKAKEDFRGFAWLKTGRSGGMQEIDIWIPELKLAIEYDGEQHFRPVRFGGISVEMAESNYIEQKRRDTQKNSKIHLHQDEVKYFVRFSYTESITEEYVRSKLALAGVAA
jgi:hypothetical protein